MRKHSRQSTLHCLGDVCWSYSSDGVVFEGFLASPASGGQPGSLHQELLLGSASPWPGRERQEPCPACFPRWNRRIGQARASRPV